MSSAGAERIGGVTLALEYRMPLFEYECRGCGRRFEYLTRGDQSPACPSCQGVELQKLLSAEDYRSHIGETAGSGGD